MSCSLASPTGASGTSHATSASSWRCNSGMERRCPGWTARSRFAPTRPVGSTSASRGFGRNGHGSCFVVGRPAEALDAAAGPSRRSNGMKDSNDGHVLAYSRIVLARLLSETGRPDAAEPAARAAMAWFERWGLSHPQLRQCRMRSRAARKCFKARRAQGGPLWSTACRFIAPGAMPIPARYSPSTGC